MPKCAVSVEIRFNSDPAQAPNILQNGNMEMGFPLKILSRKGSWVKVKDFENDTGWVFKKYLTSKPHMIVKVNKGKKKKINIRSGPGTKYKAVGRAYYGVVFQTLGQEKGWAKVRHESGLTGWIKRSLLWGY